ncbi:MAG: lipopolysaccharide assembly protein LapB [Burkholderiales bacterium]
MEIDLWWLLALPAFFALGWGAARVDIRHVLSQSRALPGSYFRGLNHLLNEEPDRAIDAFIEVVKVDPETIELHFALGNLFRRRGEVERAIRMHSSLANRADLDEGERLRALFELGQDYLRAGLLDRAEEALTKLGTTPFAARSRVFLLEIAQMERDWSRAIDLARQVESDSGHSRQRDIAQFHCESAAAKLAQSLLDEARSDAVAALAVNRMAVRANLILGDIEARAGRHAEAIALWRGIESQDPAYLALAGARLIESHRAQGRVEEGLALLAGYLERYPSLDLLELVFRLTMELQGVQAALRVVREEMRKSPSLAGAEWMLEAQAVDAPGERVSDLNQVRNLVHTQAQRMARYACENCDFKARQFFWRCPGCGNWESYSPRRIEEGDARF